MGCDSGFVYVFSEFYHSCNLAFSALLRTFLLMEPPETLESSMIFDFLVSSRILNLLFIADLFECFYGWGCPTKFYEGFRFVFS